MDKSKLKCNVVMLPTEKASDLFIHNPTEVLRYKGHQSELEGVVNKQHLYLVSDRKHKKGDWCLHQIQHEYYLKQAHEDNALLHYKIEATTDTLKYYTESTNPKRSKDVAYIPQIPESFIKVFVEANGNIKEVFVEYEMVKKDDTFKVPIEYCLKTIEDNTVIIHIVDELATLKAENERLKWNQFNNPHNLGCVNHLEEIDELKTQLSQSNSMCEMLAKALKNTRDELNTLMDFCVDRKHLDFEDDTDGIISYKDVMLKSREVLEEYEKLNNNESK